MAHNEELFQLFPDEALVLLRNDGFAEIVLNTRQSQVNGDVSTQHLIQRHEGWRLAPSVETWVVKRDWDKEVATGSALLADIAVVDTFLPAALTLENDGDTEITVDDGLQGVTLDPAGTPGGVNQRVVTETAYNRAGDLGQLPAALVIAGSSAYADPDAMVTIDNPGQYDVVLEDVGRHRGAGIRVPAGGVDIQVPARVWNAPENGGGGGGGLVLSGHMAAPSHGGLVLSAPEAAPAPPAAPEAAPEPEEAAPEAPLEAPEPSTSHFEDGTEPPTPEDGIAEAAPEELPTDPAELLPTEEEAAVEADEAEAETAAEPDADVAEEAPAAPEAEAAPAEEAPAEPEAAEAAEGDAASDLDELLGSDSE